MKFRAKVIKNEKYKPRKTLFIFSNWKSFPAYYLPLIKHLKKSFRIILYTYSFDIINPDDKKTIKNIKSVVSDAIQKSKSYSDLYCLGLSLGTYMAFMFCKKAYVKRCFLCSPGHSFGEFLYYSSVTKHIRDSIGKNSGWFKERFRVLDPNRYLSKKTNYFIMISRADTAIPYILGMNIVEEMKKKNISFIDSVYSNRTHKGLISKVLLNPKLVDQFFID